MTGVRRAVIPTAYLILLAALAVAAIYLTTRHGVVHTGATYYHGATPNTYYHG